MMKNLSKAKVVHSSEREQKMIYRFRWTDTKKDENCKQEVFLKIS